MRRWVEAIAFGIGLALLAALLTLYYGMWRVPDDWAVRVYLAIMLAFAVVGWIHIKAVESEAD